MYDWHYWVIVGLLILIVSGIGSLNHTLKAVWKKLGDLEPLE